MISYRYIAQNNALELKSHEFVELFLLQRSNSTHFGASDKINSMS